VPVTVPPPPPAVDPGIEIDNGVIEEARRRQRRRRTTGLAAGAGAIVITMSALLIGGGGNGGSNTTGEPSPDGPSKLALSHGRALIDGQPALMGVTLSLQGGNVGVCVKVANAGGCNGPLPSTAYPVYGGGGDFSPEEKVGPEGEIDAIFTAPSVAAMRVAHLGTFKAEAAPGLPPGARQIVFYRPPGSRGTVLPPGANPQIIQSFERGRQGPALTETLLDASGRAIPVAQRPSTFTLPNSYWQGKQAPPAQGRCAMSSSLPGVRTAWGQVATKIAPDRDLTEPGWLVCLHTWFYLQGGSYETAILLNAKSPGATPAMLWGAIPLQGHPGMVKIPAVQREIRFRLPTLPDKVQSFWQVLTPQTVARRVGPAWVLVREGRSLAARISFLEGLHVTKIGA
jgi:hypothetical protein